jgi:hypothetical protein
MTTQQKAQIAIPSTSPRLTRAELHVGRWLCLAGWLFPRNSSSDAVATSLHFDVSPETVWQGILLYEDVPQRPPFLLRVLLPYPVHTVGDKTRVGSTVHCTYSKGALEKRITVVEPPHLVKFEITEQHLAIEACITALGGSYEIRPRGNKTEAVLITNYRGHLRPRALWRPFERYFTHLLHWHILGGMRDMIELKTNSSQRS